MSPPRFRVRLWAMAGHLAWLLVLAFVPWVSGEPVGTNSPAALEAAALKQEAITVATRVADAFPKDALSQALLGSAYFNTGKSIEAARHLNRCLELDPRQAEANDILARIAYDKGDLAEAIRQCQEALKSGRPSPEVLNLLGRSQMDQGTPEAAVETLEKAIQLPHPLAESYYLVGQAYLQTGDFPRAQERFREAVGLVPDHTQAYFGLFTASQRLGQTEEAARYLKRFQELEAADRQTLTDRNSHEESLSGLALVRRTVARTLYGAAQIYRTHEQAAPSIELLRRAAALDGENSAYRGALEAAFLQRQALAEGVAAFEALTVEQPRSPLNYYFLARLHGRLGNVGEAERAYRKVIDLAPAWSDGYRALADLLIRTDRRSTDAPALIRKAVELEPSAANFYVLSLVCQKNRDRAGAIEAMKRAVAANPNDPRYREVLHKLQAQPGPNP